MRNEFLKIILLILFLVIPIGIIAQEFSLDNIGRLKTNHSSFLIGGGSVYYTDNYFSEIDYNAFKIGLQSEEISKFFNLEKWIYRDIIDFSFFFDSHSFQLLKRELSYTGLPHYSFDSYDNFNFYLGGGPSISFGFNTDTTNFNNDYYYGASFDLRLSGMIIYHLSFENFLVLFKLSSQVSTIGVSFIPEYGQLFQIIEPNKSNFVFTNWANSISHKHQLSVDIPYKNTTYKLAYQYEGFSSKLNNNMYKQSGGALYIGFAHEFVRFSGKKAMNKKNLKSLIYE